MVKAKRKLRRNKMAHPHYDVFVAWDSGKQIQILLDQKWEDDQEPKFYKHCEYRVKPELESEPIAKNVK